MRDEYSVSVKKRERLVHQITRNTRQYTPDYLRGLTFDALKEILKLYKPRKLKEAV
jgi:hypothetical protein